MGDYNLEDYSGIGMLGGLVKGAAQGLMQGEEMADRREDRKLKRIEQEAKVRSDEVAQKQKIFEQRLEARKAGLVVPPEGESWDPGASDYRPDYIDMKTREAAAMGGKMLPSGDVLKVQEGASIPKMLNNLDATLTNKAALFGPVRGRAGSLNPYNTDAQTVDAQMRTASQAFGKFMEGGVLRKEDEEKYRKMFPQLSDQPDVAKNKLALVRQQLIDKQNADVAALGAQGYRTKGFKELKSKPEPGLLKSLGPKSPAAAGGAPDFDNMTDEQLRQYLGK